MVCERTKRFQGIHGDSKDYVYKEIPRNTRKYKKGTLSRTEWYANVQRDSKEYNEMPMNTKECNEMPRNTKEYNETPRNTRKYKRNTK